MSRWPTVALGEVCTINPRLDRLTVPSPNVPVSFVPMAAVDEFKAEIKEFMVRPYEEVSKGYTAFKKGDVLFAKITPCMENGKVAVVGDLVNGFGFGSTEFHVLRSSDQVLPDYLYHFA